MSLWDSNGTQLTLGENKPDIFSLTSQIRVLTLSLHDALGEVALRQAGRELVVSVNQLCRFSGAMIDHIQLM